MVKNKLKQLLDNRGIKQTWLAEKIGINKGTLSNIVNEKYCPGLDTAFQIAHVLNLKIDDIFYWNE